MKILRILPKSLRKRIMIKELQRFRQTAERKQALKSTRQAKIVSQDLLRQSQKSKAAAKKYDTPNTQSAKALLLQDSKESLQQSKDIVARAQKFSNTKKGRDKLKHFWELDKK
jgi:hypothetical protein